jgi:hypothetical protein
MNHILRSTFFMSLVVICFCCAKTRAQTPSISVTTVNFQAKSDGIRVVAQGDVVELQLEVVDAGGEVVFETLSLPTQEMEWDMRDAQGVPARAGQYTCIVTFKDASGKIRKRIEPVTIKKEAAPEPVAAQTAQTTTDIPVIHDSTLSGDGTELSPLSVAMPLQSDGLGNLSFGSAGSRVKLPSDAILQLGADGLGRGNLRFPTTLSGKEFSLDVSEQFPGDPVLSIGYNSRAATRINTAEPALFHTIEGDYHNPVNDDHFFEMNTQVIAVNGRQHRLQAFSARRSDAGQVSWMWAGDDFRFVPTGELDPTGYARPFFWANARDKQGLMQGSWGIGVSSPTGLTTVNRVVVPNGSYYAGLNGNGTGSISLIGTNSSNRILIATGASQTSIGSRLLVGKDQATTAALTIYGVPGSKDGQRIRIGQSSTVDYSIFRDPLTGKLYFTGTQGAPYVGYIFDATVEAKSISPGGGVTWTRGTTAPTGSCQTGSLYTNTTGTQYNTLYVCAGGVWIAK